MKNYFIYAVAGALMVSMGVSLISMSKGPDTTQVYATSDAQIKWLNIEDLEAAQKKERRKVIIDLYTDWCGWCKVMDKKTFKNANVATKVNEKFYAVKFDAEMNSNVIYKQKVYKYLPEGKANELAIELLDGRMGYPTTVYLDEKLNKIGHIPGYIEADKFLRVLDFYEKDMHKIRDADVEKYMNSVSK